MIKTESILYKIDQRLNKLSSNAHQQIPLEDKILAANEAQLNVIKQKLDGDNIYRLGFDAFKKRYEDLQKLVENYNDHPISLVLTDKYLNKWVASLTEDISPKYMFYVDSYVIASKGECKGVRIDVNNDLAKHSDIPTLLNNSNYRPSFEYRETFSIVATDEIGIFTDGTFTPSTLYLSYIRYPQEIDSAGYVKFDGTDSTNSDCELEEYLEDELLDLIVENLAMFTENNSAASYAKERQAEDE
jgi:hypothetical protein